MDVVKHVQCDPTADGGLSPHSVHGLLHLAMPAVGPFHGVGGQLQQAIVQEGQALLQVGGLKALEDRPQSLEATDALHSRASFTSSISVRHQSVEQAVDLLHHFPEGPHLRQTPS